MTQSPYTVASGQIALLREAISGHSHRVELFLSVLGLAYRTVDIDLHCGEAQSDAFRRLNPLSQVPVLLHGSNVICDSNAILCYLAYQFEAWNWWPQEPDLVWQIQRWMSVAAGELLAGPVIARRITVYKRDFDQRRAIAASNRFLAFLDGHLCDKTYLVNNAPTVADIAIYTYTAHAPEGAISLKPFNHVRNWLRRIESWPRFIGMQPSRIPEPLNI